jgi:MFS superfamily sulfate permease-like transporter
MFKKFFKDLKQEFTGYNSAKLMKDVMAGLTVCAVALPLALAFGVSSGASAASGLDSKRLRRHKYITAPTGSVTRRVNPPLA